jgi:hypothetical protein
MSSAQRIEVSKLQIDLQNYRTVPQPDEIAAVRAMISIKPNQFWGLMDSLLQDGYLPIENVIVLKGKGSAGFVVKEGNRRVACLKLIHGLISDSSIDLPPHIEAAIKAKDSGWLDANKEVPCLVYPAKDEAKVDKIVSLTHGKGESAGRDKWEAVARARHNREKLAGNEPGLDLLEKYLAAGKNLTADQAERWSGTYNLTVLDEALKRIAPRFGCKSSRELADSYPKVKKAKVLDQIMLDIGLEAVGFAQIRSQGFFDDKYGLKDPNATGAGTGTGASGGSSGGAGGTAGKGGTGKRGAAKTPTLNDPRSVKKMLRNFAPRGPDKAKVATLVQELRDLNIAKNPHAFCFVLRSTFEISAKQFANAKSIPTTKKGGKDLTLLELLRAATQHLLKGKPKADPMTKRLHGAMRELATPHGILSVTSMNQLVHNPHFSAKAADVCIVFHNIFPLLEELTK